MKGRFSYALALRVAQKLAAQLGPSCERIEIAGSIRRRCATVGDIEIVAIPRMRSEQGLFGPVGTAVSLLDEHLAKFPEVYYQTRSGERMKQLVFEGYQVDLFLTTPAQWGVIFMLRTGSADFSHWLVTDRQKGGGRMSCRTVNEGRVWRLVDGEGPFAIPIREAMETPEEKDVFEALGVDWVPVEKRDRGYWSRIGSAPEDEKARDYV
jgi:hypothetical protein